jgi:acetoin utilization protein AcuC
LRSFSPEILVSQHGCDTHRIDPLAQLALTVDGQRAAHVALHDLAHEVAGGRWIAVGGGGYALAQVVPRTWTHLLAIAAGAPIDPATPTPMAWQANARARTGGPAPESMTDGGSGDYRRFEAGHDPGDPVDRAIMATMNATFPAHGLLVGGLG